MVTEFTLMFESSLLCILMFPHSTHVWVNGTGNVETAAVGGFVNLPPKLICMKVSKYIQ